MCSSFDQLTWSELNNLNNITSTYTKPTKPSQNASFLKSEFNLKVTKINKKLPNIYWIMKLRKNLTKARFIITAPKCSMKLMSKDVIAAPKVIYNQIEHYNFKTQYHSGAKTFLPVQDNQAVTNAIKKINLRNKAFSISGFDFSILYSNIPHLKLKSVMEELIIFCFYGGVNKSIGITRYCAT